MIRGILIGVVLTVVVLALGAYVAVINGLVPANADGKAGSLERWAANASLDATITRETAGMTSPIQPTEQNLAAGFKIYGENCAVCHGTASGSGTNIARGFYQHAPQFGKHHGPTHDPVEETYWKATHGVRFTAMPAFATTLDDNARWQVSLFLKNMGQLPPAVEKTWKALKVAEALAPPMPDRPGPAK